MGMPRLNGWNTRKNTVVTFRRTVEMKYVAICRQSLRLTAVIRQFEELLPDFFGSIFEPWVAAHTLKEMT
ncbi:hypothetical protein Y032_0201g1715 [Ancylostoma ceylanicum]|uniref:Uncharacterized protein n=1 Tax=Ancylostoma ceylanicum TaxID=53326 RepID=A0A016SMF5_9BILA|nr:hypothetical protein Y032_0201g1715 [Ancylostoma ceylanicum]